MSKKEKTIPHIRMSFALTQTLKTDLDTIAAKQHMTTSELIRGYIDKGMNVDKTTTDISFIRTQIREELSALLMPQINRLIKIVIKTGLMSVGSFYLLCDVLAEFVPMTRRQPLEQSIETAKKKAAIYLKIKDNLLDELMRSFE